jgi:hypothetical protein
VFYYAAFFIWAFGISILMWHLFTWLYACSPHHASF